MSFQYKSDAEKFYDLLKRRMGHFGMSLEEEKSRLIEFGRFAERNSKRKGKKPQTFDFLDFTHYCSQNRNGKFRVKRKTSKKKIAKKCKEIHKRIRSMRTWKVKEIIAKLNQILIGHYHYYGITDNLGSLKQFRWIVLNSLFYWLNRRSQKRSYTWEGYLEMLNVYPLVFIV